VTVEEISAATGLVAVVSSCVLTIVSVRRAERSEERARARDLALSLIPKRLYAFEVAWSAIYEIQERGQLPEARLEQLVAATLWLPEEVRSGVLALAAQPAGTMSIPELRTRLLDLSGASLLHQFLLDMR
jgi:hypothetical protein